MKNKVQIKVTLYEDDYAVAQKMANDKGITLATLFRKSLAIDMPENSYKPKGFGVKKSDNGCNLSVLYYLSRNVIYLSHVAKYCNVNNTIDRQVLILLEKYYDDMWSVVNDT